MTPSRHEAFQGGPSVPLNKRKQRSLLSKRNILFLSETIWSRDRMNNGMSRKEVIVTIMNLVPGILNKQAENCFDHCVRKKKIPGLKSGGKVQKVQSTSTKRAQITKAQQFCWHCLMDTV